MTTKIDLPTKGSSVSNKIIEQKTEQEMTQKKVLKGIGQNQEFKALVKKRRTFLFSTTFIFLALYISLPILTSFTTVLHQKMYGEITWVWVYALSLFVMTIVLCSFYIKGATRFDREMKVLVEKLKDGGF
ncbi:DUF485 domain-containing protein [Kurthia gibsonii]|uniref:DUF485 domain-containing protein n=1 Tax=Kurthia TaxID=1649 RepID=UPI00254E6A55|nr:MULTISPECIES: DUF485 domain-containing protein [Kurthia]MEB6112117.1 DUF485 domain-containing protein [Kurthia gibsonii]WIL37317.1 DUF485 domain-containing protein [Kurthia sp. YJT4]HZG12539.1 DUF485 domain-containing protein [Kurthia gibsonii]